MKLYTYILSPPPSEEIATKNVALSESIALRRSEWKVAGFFFVSRAGQAITSGAQRQ
jgi:hypothetical protein